MLDAKPAQEMRQGQVATDSWQLYHHSSLQRLWCYKSRGLHACEGTHADVNKCAEAAHGLADKPLKEDAADTIFDCFASSVLQKTRN